MTTTPDNPTPAENDDNSPEPATPDEGAPGAEVGMSDDGSTFEPEEDPGGYS
jgi:hypothetical protein